MRRIELAGAELDFPEGCEGHYVKLILPSPVKPTKRTYTIVAYDAGDKTLTLDMIDHGDSGPGSIWARNARVGDSVKTTGVGKKSQVLAADWYLFVGDMSAIPALTVHLGQLSKQARGYALIEVPNEKEIRPIDHPDSVKIDWVINPSCVSGESVLSARVMRLRPPPGELFAWVAGEFSSVSEIRRHLSRLGLSKASSYVSPYWKHGATNEELKRAKALIRLGFASQAAV
jgi:NADPH-dependent ferric siderophore reductase